MTLRRRAVIALTVATLLTAALNVALAPNERPVMFEFAPNADALQCGTDPGPQLVVFLR